MIRKCCSGHALAVECRHAGLEQLRGCRAKTGGRKRCLGVSRRPRARVRALFDNLEDGATVTQFLEWFPGVTREQVEAVLEHAARSLQPA